MQECNLMEAQAQKLSLLFSNYAADSKVESTQLDEGLMGALTGGAIGTGIGALAGGAVQAGADNMKSTALKGDVAGATDAAAKQVDVDAKAFLAVGGEFDGNNMPIDKGSEYTPDATSALEKFNASKDKLDKLKSVDTSKLDLGIDDKGNISGIDGVSDIKAGAGAKTADWMSKNSIKTGAAIGGVTGAAVGHAATRDKDTNECDISEDDENSSVIATESMKVYEMFRAAVDEEEQASNAKKAGYSAAGAFLGTAAGGPMSGALGALAGGAAGAAMTNTDGEQRSQQLGRATGAGVGGAVGAALTCGSLAGTAVGGAAGAMLGDTVGKIVGNKHSNPTPVRNRSRRPRPTP